MLSLRSGILAEAIIIVSSSVLQKQSIFLASLLQCPHFRSSRSELFCKKGVFKNFAVPTQVNTSLTLVNTSPKQVLDKILLKFQEQLSMKNYFLIKVFN